jgi:hypothetical protein
MFSMVKLPNSDEGLRLLDDGFCKICSMVNDVSMKVRAEAASLLVSERNEFGFNCVLECVASSAF